MRRVPANIKKHQSRREARLRAPRIRAEALHPGHNRADRHRNAAQRHQKRRGIALSTCPQLLREQGLLQLGTLFPHLLQPLPQRQICRTCTLLLGLRLLPRLARTSARPKRNHKRHRGASGVSRLLPAQRQSARGTKRDIRASGQAHPQGATECTALLQPRQLRRQQLRVGRDCGPQRHKELPLLQVQGGA